MFLFIYHYHHKQVYCQILFSIIFQLFSIFDCTFCLLLILKEVVVLPSNFLTWPIICGSLMDNGLITSLSLHPIKYLNELFVLYGSSLETNILLTSMSSILALFLFLWKSLFFIFLSPNFKFFPLFLTVDEKSKIFSITIWVYVEWWYISL